MIAISDLSIISTVYCHVCDFRYCKTYFSVNIYRHACKASDALSIKACDTGKHPIIIFAEILAFSFSHLLTQDLDVRKIKFT